MKEKIEDTPPPSPGFGDNDDEDDEMFEDEVAEEIDVIDGEAEAGDRLFTSTNFKLMISLFREIMMRMLMKKNLLSFQEALINLKL